MTARHRVLVVEDDPTMREMLEYNLTRRGYEVTGAPDGRAALARAVQARPHLVLLDLMLPEVDGLTACRELRRKLPRVSILFVTARSEEEMKLRGFEAGADDYVTKPFSMEELLARVEANLRRAPGVGERPVSTLRFGDMAIDLAKSLVEVRGRAVVLRAKEIQLLQLLASEPGRLFSRPEIAERVWGFEYLGDSRTIDVHIKNLRQKIEADSAYRCIETVRGLGYRFRIRPKDGDGDGGD